MDHLRRGTLRLDRVRMIALDEADEMLKMGFLEDVEWILSQVPEERRTALFSATLPPEIRRVASRHLRNPVMVEIERRTLTVPAIEQRYLNVHGPQRFHHGVLRRIEQRQVVGPGRERRRRRNRVPVELGEVDRRLERAGSDSIAGANGGNGRGHRRQPLPT